MRCAGAVIFMLVFVTGASAQQSARSDVRAVFDRVEPGTLWKVRTAENTFEGRLQDRNPMSVGLSGLPPIPFDQIERAWLRGRATGSGAKWGALSLAIISAAVVGYDCSRDGAELDCNVPLAAAIGGAAGAVGGFVIGIAVGSLIPQWQLRFP